jgi:sulfur-oxidizing protein SoxX
MRALAAIAAAATALGTAFPAGAAAQATIAFDVTGDAIELPLADTPGDAARGRAIVASRTTGLCLLCHSGPIPEERAQGTLAPSLAGAGSRLTAGQLRLRVADARRVNPDSLMPSYAKTGDFVRVAPAFAGKPILTAAQIEDVVAYLVTLRDPAAIQ